jgi:hypothetical protein
MGFMSNLRNRREAAGLEAVATEQEVAEMPPGSGPPLIAMLPDAGGLASYTVRTFASAMLAERFIDTEASGSARQGIVAFWALAGSPAARAYAEPIVIIRDQRWPVVYPFSFSDIDSAHDFVRHEMQRGLDLGQVMVYWAVPVTVETDSRGHAVLTPSEPPVVQPASAGLAPAPVVWEEPEVPMDRPITPPSAPVRIPIQMSGTYAVLHDTSDVGHVIDFEAASRVVQESRTARQPAAIGLQNALLAIDEALDAHVSRIVVARISWRRISGALAAAAAQRERAISAAAFRSLTTAIASSLDADRSRRAIAYGWQSATRGLACAAYLEARATRLRRAWLNIAWTLEEAAWACSLERRAIVLRAWRAASQALAEAVPFAEQAERARNARVSAGVANLTAALSEVAVTKRRQDGLADSWGRVAVALAAAGARVQATRACALGWSNAVSALRVAAITSARLLLESARLDEREIAEVERAIGAPTYGQDPSSLGSVSRGRHWQPRGEPFRGFGSPTGRF